VIYDALTTIVQDRIHDFATDAETHRLTRRARHDSEPRQEPERASLGPASRAARLNVLEAIATT
jgi:hypothetical protein